MLDLRSMSDDEFTVLVTPTVPQTTMRVTVEESGKILLSSKVAAKLSQTPMQYLRDTYIQKTVIRWTRKISLEILSCTA